MGTLYLDHQGLSLQAESGAIVLRGAEEKPRSIPLALLERVVVQGEAEISSGLLGRMAEAGVGLLVLSKRQSWRTACLLGRPHKDARIRLAQYQVSLNAAARVGWARLWLRGKLHNQERLLAAALRRRPELIGPLTQGRDRVHAAAARLADAAGAATIETLRGLEGAAAAAYFRAFVTLFAPALGFGGRNRRPPRDPVNAALSLAYTLLHFEAVRAAQAAGLDPLLGTLHEPAYGRESLACDLVEPLRPRVDGWVWELFRERLLRLEHFTHDKGACLLHKAGRRNFYEAWEDGAARFRPALRGYCRLLVARLRGVSLDLAPAPPDWSEYALENSIEQYDGEEEEPDALAVPDRL